MTRLEPRPTERAAPTDGLAQAISELASRLGIAPEWHDTLPVQHLVPHDEDEEDTGDADPQLVHTLHAVTGRLGLGERAPTASVDTRAGRLIELLETALSDIDARWPQRIVTAACDVADSEGIDDLDDIRAFVAAFVQRALDAQPYRRTNHYRNAVEWADEVGYLYGSVQAERVALGSYRALVGSNPERALERLERAIFHRSARFTNRDTTLPELRLAAAELSAELGRHEAVVEYVDLAWPALDAAGDPLDDRMIDAFRMAGRAAHSSGNVAAATRHALEAVRRGHAALERAVERGEPQICTRILRNSEAELELSVALAHSGNIPGALRWAVYVTGADAAVIGTGAPVWIDARFLAARYHAALGERKRSAEILTDTIALLRPLLGDAHSTIADLKRLLHDL